MDGEEKYRALRRQWLREEQIAHIHGWDFSRLRGRYREEDDLPWDYTQVVRAYLTPQTRLLDIDTGGGEFLLSLGHPGSLLAATEDYPPNLKLCEQRLLPLGVELRRADANTSLPFADARFDLVIDRHGSFCPAEIRRVLRPGGVFITEQVGAENDRELVELLLGKAPPLPFPGQYLALVQQRFTAQGFTILQAQEAFRPIRFWDVGALVWFARVIPWEFPGFSVESCLPGLLRAQQLLEKNGVIEGRIHRFLLAARRGE